MTHGTRNGYLDHKCRCAACTSAHSDYQRQRRAARYAARQLVGGCLVAVDAPRHGNASTYGNWGCRCQPCAAAGAAHNAANKAARRARAA